MMQATSSVAGRGKWPRMSYEEYLDDLGIPEATEWVDGEVVEMMSVSPEHARLVAYLFRLLGSFLEARPLGEVFGEPFNMKTGPSLPGRSPDLLVILNDHAARVTEKNLAGPADIVIEVISPGTEATDRGSKFLEYEAGGVNEYWILDPHRLIADFYLRGSDGLFHEGERVADGAFASTVLPGLRVHPDWLWSRRPVRHVMRELGLDD
jgi:Uma2 family endonuclease